MLFPWYEERGWGQEVEGNLGPPQPLWQQFSVLWKYRISLWTEITELPLCSFLRLTNLTPLSLSFFNYKLGIMEPTISELLWESVASSDTESRYFFELLLDVKYSSKYFAYVNLQNPVSTYEMRKILLLSQLYSWENWGSGCDHTPWLSTDPSSSPGLSDSRVQTYNCHCLHLLGS